MLRAPLPALLLLAACSAPAPMPETPADLEGTYLLMIVAEDGRLLPPGLFEEAAKSSDAGIRARAAVSLGRIMKLEGIPTLVALASDAHPEVRKAAVFAMGQLGLRPDGLAVDQAALLLKEIGRALKDPDEGLRAVGVEAMGKLAGDQAPTLALPFLKDSSALVRRQAASACFRWRQVLRWRDPAAKAADLPKDVVEALSAAADDADAEVRWRAVHALHRSASQPAPEQVKRFLADSEPLCRLFALNLVERMKTKDLADDVARAQKDADAGVRQAALRALDALDRADLLDPALVGDPSFHVRQAVGDLLSAEGPVLETLSKDVSTTVRTAALLARVRISGEGSLASLEAALTDSDPYLRAAAVRGAGELKDRGLPLIEKARKDSAEVVRAAALTALGGIEGESAFNLIREGLKAKSLAERGGAVESLMKRREPGVLEAAQRCFRMSSGRDWVEIREAIVDLFAGRTPEESHSFLLEAAIADPAPSVRQKAAAALRKRGAKGIAEGENTTSTKTPHWTLRFPSNPVVVLETNKGTMEIECYAYEAPAHVANFVGLVESGFYDGLLWHRVVSNFVIQGGDPLGSGMGDAGWSLRAEINPVPYRRGTLGMPRSAGFDTGGCQIFITHLPTPHLDGYYTVFGEVVKGLEVIDRIEIGDRIVRATVRR